MKTETIRRTVKGRRFRPAKSPVPGGKALARLHEFQRERGLDLSDVRRPKLVKPLLAPPRGSARGKRGGAARTLSPYLAAFESLRRMKAAAPAVPVPTAWRPLGPSCVPHGQTYGSGPGSRPSIAGRVSTIAVDPSNPSHLLVGSAGGGVWESFDDGATWSSRTDDQPALATGAVAFDPTNPLIAYTGTGEGDTFSALGVGLLRSTDGGTTWGMLSSTPFQGVGFHDIVVDPLNGNHLLVATTGGVYESSNGGSSWNLRRAQLCWKLSMHPSVPGDPQSTAEVFAACNGGVARSTDGGTTWGAVALPGAPAAWNRIEVCHAPSDGGVVYVFAAGGASAYLWRRDSYGGAFSAMTLPTGGAAIATGQAWYDWFAAVAPNNPDVVYLGAINAHKGIRSATGVWSWENITARSTGDSVHPDQHAIAFGSADPNVVYIGNDGGFFRSPDGGTTWRSLNKGLAITEFEYITQHPAHEAWLLGGTQDNGTLRYEGQEVWYHVQDGDGGDCGTNSASPYTCFHTFYGLGMERSTTGGGWGSWSWIGPSASAGEQDPFYPPVEVNGNVVVMAGSVVHISTDSGNTWTSVGLPAVAGTASALAIPNASLVLVGTGNGRLYSIAFIGGSWQAPTALTQPRSGYLSDIHADPGLPNRYWVTYSSISGGHVYRSDDGGGTWTDTSAGLPSIPFNAAVVDPTASNVVYAAADVGVYRSTDSGATWAAFSNGLPNALVKDLVFHAPSRLLRAATQSRGVWEIAVDPASVPDVEAYLRDSTVDTGRLSPSPSGVDDPFNFGAKTWWWQCCDVKVDSPSYQQPSLGDVDYEVFADDHGVFAAGLIHETAQRGRNVRVYVQVHNRGVNPAMNVAVKAFFADASVGLPDLPAGFWAGFPGNTLPPGSPWTAVAPHKVIPVVEARRSEVVGFDWSVPSTAAPHTCLLALVSASNDSIATGELVIGSLVPGNKKSGLKNLVVVDPPPSVGPRIQGLILNLWGSRRWRRYRLGVDKPAHDILRGFFPSRHRASTLIPGLRESPPVVPMERRKPKADEVVLAHKLLRSHGLLEKDFDLTAIYRPKRPGVFVEDLQLDLARPDKLLILLEPAPRRGHGSLILYGDEGDVVGGFTLAARGKGGF